MRVSYYVVSYGMVPSLLYSTLYSIVHTGSSDYTVSNNQQPDFNKKYSFACTYSTNLLNLKISIVVFLLFIHVIKTNQCHQSSVS
jgi:hypothetical protein